MSRGRVIVIIAGLLFAVGGGYLIGRVTTGVAGPSAGGPVAPPAEVTATVRTRPITKGTVAETVQAFGTVAPGPGGVRSVALDYAARVAAIYVRPGQAVSQGQKLLAVTASPTTGLAVNEARINAQAAKRQLDVVTRRHTLGLAAQASVDAAQAAFDAAQARLVSLEQQQAQTHRTLRAKASGSVQSMPVSPGDLIPAGQALVVLTETGGHEARLGVTAEVARAAQLGTPVTLRRVLGEGAAVTGRLEAVDGSVDPATGLVSLHVSLPDGASLLPGEALSGHLALRQATGLVVPHAAVLPEAGREVLFTVDHSRAVRHAVKVVLQNDTQVVVKGSKLAEGQAVVVLGNAELEDGMAVRVEAAR